MKRDIMANKKELWLTNDVTKISYIIRYERGIMINKKELWLTNDVTKVICDTVESCYSEESPTYDTLVESLAEYLLISSRAKFYFNKIKSPEIENIIKYCQNGNTKKIWIA